MTKTPYHRENLTAAIQQRARYELETSGAAQLSLRQLAKFLAVTPAAIYRHFPDKASLLAALRTEILDEVTVALHRGVLESPDAATMLRQLVTNLLTYARDHRNAIAFVLTDPWPAPQSLQTILALLVAQAQLPAVPQTLVSPVWTFLLGVLCQPDAALTVDWVSDQVSRLVGLPQ